jgi:hypothetical protein
MKKVKKFVQGTSVKKIPKLASKTIIFEVFEAERDSSQFFITDFQSKNTHSG